MRRTRVYRKTVLAVYQVLVIRTRLGGFDDGGRAGRDVRGEDIPFGVHQPGLLLEGKILIERHGKPGAELVGIEDLNRLEFSRASKRGIAGPKGSRY